ncbi:MAG TPA: helix-turn-helix transcriptional regulator [Myxococcales bacterium]|jgi:ribosome-binding protein aMBF1 (putative translation factor)|nr:helix-turn-helix transcriptional regulator [Myxococcales bacterium]
MAKKKEPPSKKERPRKPRRPRTFDKEKRKFVEEISAALLKMRKVSGLTQGQVALLTGRSQALVHRGERAVKGLMVPDFDRVRKLAAVMGWHTKIVFTEPAPGVKAVQVDRPAPTRKKIIGPVVPAVVQKQLPWDEVEHEPPGAW